MDRGHAAGAPANVLRGVQAASRETGRCTWLEEAQSCVEAFQGPGSDAYALFSQQIKECPFADGLGKCPSGASSAQNIHSRIYDKSLTYFENIFCSASAA